MLKARLLYTAKILFHVLGEFGYNPIKMLVSILELPLYIYQLTSFSIRSKSPVKIRLFPYLTDRRDFAGSISRHYFHQDLWAARKVYENKPENHIDVGSRIDGFVAHFEKEVEHQNTTFAKVIIKYKRNLTLKSKLTQIV
ncbi:hypothetical protein CEP14_09860 [Cylindrospermopsis raciborskii C04]|uniref:Uncharacterized protein n=1 Tax=Cylindrospermopsis raciborskii C07 TaxID=2014886 RepID=A0ABX4WKK2_9CYAN|nr:hypothetical protein [Cylindrospermopsis raciborskii]PNJ92618.1 hypothetical protein CEP15_16215 [Cylindrospermopsis raciborskii C07]PNJ93444.1 hypothetical protein CEP13_12750 [Cylindrospermopsis raciborskii C03]PNJ95023.1 hypothetical protein CEP14_09860 [Cylindrospermopsis raciborskii C04]